MNELFKTDEFRRFLRKQVSMMAHHIWSLMTQDRFQEAKGALDLALKSIKFPTELSSGDDTQMMIKGVIAEFKADFIKVDFD